MKNKRLYYTILSILLGLIAGAIILLLVGVNPLQAYKELFRGVFGQPKYISWTIITAVPIILTGVSVAFAFNTGVFNIGAEGQFLVGSLAATIVGVVIKLPPGLHALVAILCGALAGSLWGGIVGLFKAKRGVNEVISCIMFNWIAFYLNNYMLTRAFLRKPNSNYSYSIEPSASIRFMEAWQKSDGGKAFLKEHALLRGLMNPPVNWGILFAVVVAIVVYFILKKTKIGYELKAVGFNPHAAEYGGIDISKNIIRAMLISGGIAGLAGAVDVLGVTENISLLAATPGYGFDGIAVSLIAANNPLLCILSGFLFAGLNYGGAKLNSRMNTPSEIINIIIGLIVLFVAMPELMSSIRRVRDNRRARRNNLESTNL